MAFTYANILTGTPLTIDSFFNSQDLQDKTINKVGVTWEQKGHVLEY